MSDKKVWLVTGSSRGIGLAVAERALAAGDKVALLARGAEINSLAERLGENSIACQADVSQREQVLAAVVRIMSTWGRLDIVVNNAGAHRGGKVERLSLVDWQTVIDTNLTGALNVISAASPHLQRGGAVVNIGAVVGFSGPPGD